MILSTLTYAVDAWIIAAYFYLSRSGLARPFHLANAIGCIPVIGVEIVTHAYPVMPLTVCFGIAGAIGLFRDEAKPRPFWMTHGDQLVLTVNRPLSIEQAHALKEQIASAGFHRPIILGDGIQVVAVQKENVSGR